MKKIAIIGAGSFGTALAMVLTRAGNSVKIWAREKEVADAINHRHKNEDYLPGVSLSQDIVCYNNLEACLDNPDIVLFATPSHAVREVAGKVKPYLSGKEIIVNVAKGIENDTQLRISEVLDEVLEDKIRSSQIVVLTGPSHAEEVARFQPTTIVAASESRENAEYIQSTFMTPMFRIYVNNDIIGVEIGGAVKNIIALAAGIADGFELGDNAKAALLTRGLHEMKRLATALGASTDTLSGLTGMGDLIVTCTSQHSRNRRFGYRIGKGEKMKEIEQSMNMVAEGVKTTRAVKQWADSLDIEMPITNAVFSVLFEDENPKDMLYQLMTRTLKDEKNM